MLTGANSPTRRMLAWPTFLCLAITLACCGCAAGRKEPRLSAAQRQLNVQSFDEIWTTIRDTHWDPELGGLDWNALRDEYRPIVESAERMSEARSAMRGLIARLEQTHFSITPKELRESLETDDGHYKGDGDTGLDVRVIDGQPLVTAVREGSPADKLGIKPGWGIVAVDDKKLKSNLEALAEELADSTFKDGMLARFVMSRLRGSVDDSVHVEFLDGQDHRVVHDITLGERRGNRYRLGHLAPFYVWFESRLLADNIGYIAFNGFMDPTNVMRGFNEAMASFMDADGIVIDLRGNPGGIGAMAMGMASWLISEKNQRLGTMHMRTNEINFVVNPRAQTYAGPVVLLIDGLTGSTSEIFSGGLKDLGRATVVGSRTAGAALPATMSELANGDGFLHAIANYISQGGDVLEGAGVTPHIEVVPTRKQLLAGRDPTLDKAKAVIAEQKLKELKLKELKLKEQRLIAVDKAH